MHASSLTSSRAISQQAPHITTDNVAAFTTASVNLSPSSSSSSPSSCIRISDPSATEKAVYSPSSYSSIPINSNCMLSPSNSEWIKRASKPAVWEPNGHFGRDGADESWSYILAPLPLASSSSSSSSSPSSTKSCPLEFFDPDQFLSRLSGKTISFYGDSLMRQFFGQIQTMLYPHLLSTTEHSIIDDNARKRKITNPIRVYTYEHDVILKNQWVTGHQGERALIDSIAPIMLQADLLIFNTGAFHNDPELLRRSLESFVREIRASSYSGTLLYREYSPSHFNTVDGEFISDRSDPRFSLQYPCTDENRAMQSYSTNWRLHVANEVMEKAHIPIMRIFNQSSYRADTHPKAASDCRHWFHPSSVLESWAMLLFNMIKQTG